MSAAPVGYPSFYEKALAEIPDGMLDIAQIGASQLTVCMPAMAPLTIENTRPCDDLIVCCAARANPRLRWRFEGGRWREGAARVGQLVVMPARVRDTWESDHAYESIEVAIPRGRVERMLEEAGLAASPDFSSLTERWFNDPLLTEAMRRLPALLRRSGAHDAIFADSIGQTLVLGLAHRAGNRAARHRPARRLSVPELRRLREFAAVHLDRSVSLPDFAALLGMTVFHFARAFKVTTGQTPHQWLLGLRVERARLLLAATPRLTGDEIARACGFADHPHLARVLRRVTGRSLRDLRGG